MDIGFTPPALDIRGFRRIRGDGCPTATATGSSSTVGDGAGSRAGGTDGIPDHAGLIRLRDSAHPCRLRPITELSSADRPEAESCVRQTPRTGEECTTRLRGQATQAQAWEG